MNVVNLIEFIFGIAILVLLHEFGHFLVAKLLKIEVEEFGIGFPPRMVKLFEAKGTEFTLNWIPLGGFVRPKGENDPSVEGGLAAANPWTRLAVLVAGPLMNISLGIVLAFWLFLSLGDPIPNIVQIKGITPDSPAAQAGLKPEDVILKVNNEPVDSVEEMIALVDANAGQATTITYERDGQTGSVSLVPREVKPENEGRIGILLGNPTKPVSLVTAAQRGLELSGKNIEALVMLPVRLLSGTASPEEGRPVGYKGMFDIYNQLNSPLYFFMAVSISLGVLNLMPIPALDGGRILLTLPEILLRRRIPPRYENIIHLVGFALLLLLIIYINIQDFINPINLNR